MKRIVLLLVVLLVFVAGCASVETVAACVDPDKTYGFLNGLWHGFVAPIAFIGSLFSPEIAMYAVNNSGAAYDLGFLVGINALGELGRFLYVNAKKKEELKSKS